MEVDRNRRRFEEQTVAVIHRKKVGLEPAVAMIRNRVGGLLEAILGSGWTITRPRNGWAETAFVAVRGNRRAFVKVNVQVPILRRLAELEVVPPILAAGQFDGLSYVVQEFVEAPYPEPSWFAEHLGDLATLIQIYQQDETLRALLTSRSLTCPADDLTWTEHAYRTLSDAFGDHDRLAAPYARFLAELPQVTVVPVATHGDLSRKNLLPVPGRILLVDWDAVCLSDPMRDTGPLLWWYVPPARWPEFFRAYAAPLGDAVVERAYWWAARTSLEVAHGLLDRGYRDRAWDFLEDFLAAAARKDNPHARYS